MRRGWDIAFVSGLMLALFGCGLNRTPEVPPDESEPAPVSLVHEADATDSEAYVKSCIGSLQLPESKEGEPSPKRTVEVIPKSQGDGVYFWSTGKYTLETDKASLTLKTAVALEYPDAGADQVSTLKERMDRVKDCMGSFFLRHGVRLELTWANAASDGVKLVSIRERGTRGRTFNMDNWAFGINDITLTEPLACTTMTHEFAHVLGLYDEYLERGTTRRLGEPDSLMRTTYFPQSFVKLYPRHLRAILTPLCTTSAE